MTNKNLLFLFLNVYLFTLCKKRDLGVSMYFKQTFGIFPYIFLPLCLRSLILSIAYNGAEHWEVPRIYSYQEVGHYYYRP